MLAHAYDSSCRATAMLLVLSHLWAADADSSRTLRYTILSNATTAGSEVDTYSTGGRIDSSFEFNDQGRGPKVCSLSSRC